MYYMYFLIYRLKYIIIIKIGLLIDLHWAQSEGGSNSEENDHLTLIFSGWDIHM